MNNLKLDKNKKKIVFISHNLEPEGATWSLFFLVKGMKTKGYDVSVISFRNGPLLSIYKDEGINVSIEDCFLKFNKIDVDIYFVNTILGYKFIKNYKVDKKKVIWCIRESEREIYFNKYNDLDHDLFREVSKVVFVADSTREIYSDLENNNFTTIHNGLDIKKIKDFLKKNSKDKIKKTCGFKKSDIIISIIGAVCLRKGQLEYVQSAIQVLNKTKDKNLKFILVGGRNDKYELKLKKIIKENNYEKNILIIQENPQIYKYFLLSDYFVCNSYIESFPRVILEAMAFSLPIIATNVYGISEQINNNQDGILIMAGDTSDLSKKIEWMINHKNEARGMAISAQKRVQDEFSLEIMLDKYEKLIENICVA